MKVLLTLLNFTRTLTLMGPLTLELSSFFLLLKPIGRVGLVMLSAARKSHF